MQQGRAATQPCLPLGNKAGLLRKPLVLRQLALEFAKAILLARDVVFRLQSDCGVCLKLA